MCKKVALSIAAVLLAGGLGCTTAQASVSFNISGASLTPASGYGTDASETSGATLLGVVFSPSALPLPFPLDVSNSSTFLVGTINFQEPDAGGGIKSSETNDLGVTATLTFATPLGGSSQSLTAVGTATTGSVSDSFVDYTLTWGPAVDVAFGTDGHFTISLTDLSFSGTGSQNLYATITLLAADSPTLPTTPTATTPEPGTLLLLGSGLAGLGTLARRRRR